MCDHRNVWTFALLATLASCGMDGAGMGTSTGQGDSSLTLAFTDAPSDEVDKFEVDVSGIVLHRPSGADVSVLAKAARVDFVELASVADLIADGGVPGGSYSGMSMTLDFTAATVVLK